MNASNLCRALAAAQYEAERTFQAALNPLSGARPEWRLIGEAQNPYIEKAADALEELGCEDAADTSGARVHVYVTLPNGALPTYTGKEPEDRESDSEPEQESSQKPDLKKKRRAAKRKSQQE